MPARLLLALAVFFAIPVASSQGRGGGGRADVDTIHELLDNHNAITRRVVDRADGVETWTESDDPVIAASIREHVRQMAARLDDGRPIRRWDPLFAEIFDHADAIAMEIEDTPTGVRVVETSADPYVVTLIRQHAHRAISEFVERGRVRAHEPTPLPDPFTPSTQDATMVSIPDYDDGRVATTALYTGTTRVTGLALRAGHVVPEHAVPAEAFLVVAEGAARVVFGGAGHDLVAGDGIVLPADVPHTVTATEDTRLVLVRAR